MNDACFHPPPTQVVTNLLEQGGDTSDLHYDKKEDQLDLLAKVTSSINQSNNELINEIIQDAAD
jgi:hypothetical protein